MNTVICWYSRHHGNTRKVAEAMAAEGRADLVDVTARRAVRLEAYDCIGFASGIYYGSFHQSVVDFARQYLPQGKPVFFVSTSGSGRGDGTAELRKIAREKGCPVLGRFSCRGYDTFGPFKLVGGISKGRPNEKDLENARDFFRNLPEAPGPGGL